MLSTPSPSPLRRGQRARLLSVWLPPILWAALIFYLSSLPGIVLPAYPFFSADKLLHMGVYAVLGCLVARALGYHGHARHVLVSLGCCICFLYGVSDEFHQAFVPGRNPSVMDVAADVVGAFLGIITYTRKR